MTIRRLFVPFLYVLVTLPAIALPDARVSRVQDRLLSDLRSAPEAASIRVDRFALPDGKEIALELTPFSVLAPDARIVVHDAFGAHELPIPDTRYLKGKVEGEPDSLVVLSAGDVLRGFVIRGDRVLTVAPEGDVYRGARKGDPAFVREIDTAKEEPSSAATWMCPEAPGILTEGSPEPLAVEPFAVQSTTMYAADVAVETDYELWSFFGSNAAITQYVTDLFAAGSAIYQRDIQTQLRVSYISLWSTPADPWTQTATDLALYEVGDYWHANHLALSRSTVHFLSKKNMGGGIAWLSQICNPDFLCSGGNCGSAAANGHYAGGYGVSASLNGSFSTSNSSLYWDILCSTHEIGHNFSSPHTQCYTPTPVDTCCDCAAGTCTGPVPAEKGTIMSYCHLRPGGYSNIKLFFGVGGESSQAVLTKMRTYVEGKNHTTCLPPALTSVATRLYTVAPCRVLDTRSAIGPLGGPALAGGGALRAFTVIGTCGIPASAKAITGNVTVTGASAAGDLRIVAGDVAPTVATVINFPAARTRANNARIQLATNGAGTIAVVSDGGATHFILDVSGYFQ